MKISWIYYSAPSGFSISGCDREVVELLRRYLKDEATEALDCEKIAEAAEFIEMIKEIDKALIEAQPSTPQEEATNG